MKGFVLTTAGLANGEWVAITAEWPSLSWIDVTPEKAVIGLMLLIVSALSGGDNVPDLNS